MNNSVKVEILAVGDELLYGSLVDTNSAYLAEQCQQAGMEVIRHSCVGDNLEMLTSTLIEISQRADVAIVTGGLGPTLDDLSREAAAKAKDVDLTLNKEALAEIQSFFAKLDRPMPETNVRQALFPKDSAYLPNPIGTAPGFNMQLQKTSYFFVPGVPNEMKKMFQEQVLPKILQKYNGTLHAISLLTLSTFGISEAALGEHLEKVAKNFQQVKFGTRAVFPEIQIKIFVDSENPSQTKDLENKAKAAVFDQLGNWIFSADSQPLYSIVASELKQSNLKIALTEIEIGGLLSDWFTSISPASALFTTAKIIDKNTFASLSQNSSLDANALMKYASHIMKSESTAYSIVVYGTLDSGEVSVAIADENLVSYHSCTLPLSTTDHKKKFFAAFVLDLLRRRFLKLQALKDIFGKPIENTYLAL